MTNPIRTAFNTMIVSDIPTSKEMKTTEREELVCACSESNAESPPSRLAKKADAIDEWQQ